MLLLQKFKRVLFFLFLLATTVTVLGQEVFELHQLTFKDSLFVNNQKTLSIKKGNLLPVKTQWERKSASKYDSNIIFFEGKDSVYAFVSPLKYPRGYLIEDQEIDLMIYTNSEHITIYNSKSKKIVYEESKNCGFDIILRKNCGFLKPVYSSREKIFYYSKKRFFYKRKKKILLYKL